MPVQESVVEEPGTAEVPATALADASLTPEQVIAKWKATPFDRLPVEALRAARQMSSEMIPLMRDCIREATGALRDADDDARWENNAPWFSLLLLWEFVDRDSLTVIIESLRLRGERPYRLYGESLIEDLPRILAALAPGQIDLIESLANDLELHELVRFAAVESVGLMVRDGSVAKETAVPRVREWLRLATDRKDANGMQGCVAALSAIGPKFAMQEIEKAYESELMKDWWLSLEDIHNSVEEEEAGILDDHESMPSSRIEDIVSELIPLYEPKRYEPKLPPPIDYWRDVPRYDERLDDDDDDFVHDRSVPTPRLVSARVGRNEPCPCGSGKKHKKCCGAAK